MRAAAGVPTDKAPVTAAIPLLLAQSYFALQQPAILNIRYSDAVKVRLPKHSRTPQALQGGFWLSLTQIS